MIRLFKYSIYNLILLSFGLLIFALAYVPTNALDDVEEIGEIEKLYYGYNVTGGKSLMEQDALQTTFPIIDPNSDYRQYIRKTVGSTVQQSTSFSDYSMKSLATNYFASIGAGVYGKIYFVNTNLETEFSLNESFSNNYSEYFQLYSTFISRYYYVVQLDTAEIRNYLSQRFKEELNAVKSVNDAKSLFARYGTHLNTGYTFGGRLNITNYQCTTESSVDYSQSVGISTKVDTVVGRLGAGATASFAEIYGQKENTSTNKSTYNFKSYGGEATSSLTLDGLFTYNSSLVDGNNAGYMYTRWIDSINEDKDLTIIGIPNGASSIPLWNLLENTSESVAKRKYLVNAYIELCGDKYDEYNSKFKEIERTVSSFGEQKEGLEPTFNGAYIRTKNNYFYYVDALDFSSNGEHYQLSYGDILYLDLYENSYDEYITYELQGCEEAFDDSHNKIFKVTSKTGNVVIRGYYDRNKTVSKVLLNVPVVDSFYECGTGSEKYPYAIISVDQFEYIKHDLSANYVLYSSIDFADYEHIPFDGEFTGTLNGNYYGISNFTIRQSGVDDYGIFKVNNGTIKNLKITNVGTSTRNDGFIEGGVDYRNDIKVDALTTENYLKNSISVKNAGIICGTNKGTIEGCYLKDIYIRNIILLTADNYVNYLKTNTNELCQATGAVVGYNNDGTIKNVMVTNSRLLSSSIVNQNDGDTLNDSKYKIYAIAGGVVGKLSGGEISYCVYDDGNNGSNFSQIRAPKRIQVLYSLSGGLVGYCDKKTIINNCYSYIGHVVDEKDANGNNNPSCDGHYVRLGDYSDEGNYKSVRCISIIFAPNISSQCTFANNGSYMAIDSSSYNLISYKYNALELTDKSGNNINNSNPECVKDVNAFEELSSYSPSDSVYYMKDATKSYKIKHAFENSRKDNLYIDFKDSTGIKIEFYEGEYFYPSGISLESIFNNSIREEVKYYRIEIIDNKTNKINDKFEGLGTGKYTLNVYSSFYDASNNISSYSRSLGIKIKDNVIDRIYVDDSNYDLYNIYFDSIEEYLNNFDYSSLNLYYVLTNGDKGKIENDGTYVTNGKLKLLTTNLECGDNLIDITYGTSNKSYSAKFLLEVKERTVKSITVVQNPTNMSLEVSKTVDLQGLVLNVSYDVGDDVLISGSDLSKFEITNNIISLGENEVLLTYNDYSEASTVSLIFEGYIDYETNNANFKSKVDELLDTNDAVTIYKLIKSSYKLYIDTKQDDDEIIAYKNVLDFAKDTFEAFINDVNLEQSTLTDLISNLALGTSSSQQGKLIGKALKYYTDLMEGNI